MAIFTAAATLAAGRALADAHEDKAMTDFDSDGDAMLDDAEFGEAEGGMRFGEYDTDGSGDMSEEEFAAGEFNRADRDRGGGVNEEEYARFEEDRGDGEED